MPQTKPLPDLLQQTREVRGDEIWYRFANRLTIVTEVLGKRDRLRILPLGAPQATLMNHVLAFPDTVRGKRVFEPFAGSGALGFMALKAGATHVDFLDLNPRAIEFQRANGAHNDFASDRFGAIEGDVTCFVPRRKYDLILANPPFVPTPEGIDGTLTSNGGPEGNRLVEILLARLDEFLTATGRALIYVFQLVGGGRPLVAELLERSSMHREVELTPSQERHIPFESYCGAYSRLFPKAGPAIERWRSDLIRRHGDALTLCHYVVDVGPERDGPTRWAIRENFPEKFGQAFLVPSESTEELAFRRVFENVVPA